MLRAIVAHGLAAVLAVAAWVGVAEARSLDDIIKAGVIRIGVNPNFPPNSSYNDKNELEGLRHRRRQQDRRGAEAQGRVGADRDAAARAVPRRRQDRHLAGRADPLLRAGEADHLHGAAAHRGHGGADHRQGRHHQLEAARRPQIHAGQHARQLVGRLSEGRAAQRQGRAGRHDRRHRPPGRPGPRRRDRREHRLLHGAHQELSRT